MVVEIKVDFEGAISIRYEGGCQSSRGDVKRDVPRVVDPGHLRKTDFPYDLAPKVECLIGLLPRIQRQPRPAFVLYGHHNFHPFLLRPNGLLRGGGSFRRPLKQQGYPSFISSFVAFLACPQPQSPTSLIERSGAVKPFGMSLCHITH